MASVIRGSDNFDSLVHQGIGVNQTWQDVKASRAIGVTYTNTTGKPILVAISNINSSGNFSSAIEVNGILVGDTSIGVPGGFGNGFFQYVIVPNGSTYKLVSSYGISRWVELR